MIYPLSSQDRNKGVPMERRPCPRGLEDECPIPRELCWEAYEQAGTWQCERLLEDFEWFVFGEDEEEDLFGPHSMS